MRKLLIPFALAIVLLLTTFFVLQIARGQNQSGHNGELIISSESQADNTRQITAPDGNFPETNDSNQPQISFIDSPTSACVQPDTTKDECFLNWYYMSVNADPNYMITMTVQLNDFGFVGRYGGFFQTSMYLPYDMNPQGYQVPCGV